jgi:cell division septal protein FtsQ
MPGVKPRRPARVPRSRVRMGTYQQALRAKPRNPLALAEGSLYWARFPAALLLLGALCLLIVLFNDGRFQVSAVDVEGVAQAAPGAPLQTVALRVLRPEEVQRAAGILGSNIFRLNSSELEARLKREFGCLQRAWVSAQLPNRVLVRLQEYDTVLVWESDGQSWWVDGRGAVLGMAEDTSGQVTVHDIEGHGTIVEGGGTADQHGPAYIVGVPWKLAQDMLRALPDISAFDYSVDKGLIVYVTTAEWPVYLGYEGDAQTKAALLQALAGQLMEKKINVEYIDLRNERRPTYKKR